MKNNIIAIIGGTIALFGLGYLIYVVLGFNSIQEEAAAEFYTKLDLAPIILMEVLYATLLTIIFGKYAQIKTVSTGAVLGLIIGVFIGGCKTLEAYATTEFIDLSGVLMDAVTYGVRFAVAGGVIGWALGNTKASN
jgi:hypothetical protein